MSNIFDELSKKPRVPGKGGNGRIPSASAGGVDPYRDPRFDAPYQTSARDPVTGVVLVGGEKQDVWPLGGIDMALPGGDKRLRMNVLFSHVFNSGHLDLDQQPMQMALATWMAASKATHVLAQQVQRLANVGGLAQVNQEQIIDLRMELAETKRIMRSAGLLPGRPDTEWEEIEDGVHVRIRHDVHLEIRKVGLFHPPTSEGEPSLPPIPFDVSQIDNVQSGKVTEGYVGLWDGVPLEASGHEDFARPFESLGACAEALEQVAAEIAAANPADEADDAYTDEADADPEADGDPDETETDEADTDGDTDEAETDEAETDDTDGEADTDDADEAERRRDRW